MTKMILEQSNLKNGIGKTSENVFLNKLKVKMFY